MLRQVARKPDQFPDEEQEPLDDRAARVETRLEDAAFVDFVTVPPLHRTRQAADLQLGQTECLADVAQRTPWPIGNDGSRQRGSMPAVLGIDVLDDFLAPLVLEVDVDVRRLVAFFRDKAFDKHGHARRIDLGDPEAKTHGRVGRRTPALAQNVLRTRVRHDVVDGQEVRFVFEFGDQLEFVLDEFDDARRRTVGPAPPHPLFGEPTQVARRCFAGRHDFVGILVANFVE